MTTPDTAETTEPTAAEQADAVRTQATDAFLATKYAFVKMLTEICEATGADPWDLLSALSYDDRIGWLPDPGSAPERPFDMTLYPFPRTATEG